jgi:hypothetical protein
MRLQHVSQWFHDADGFANDGAEFRKDGRLRVGLVVPLVADARHGQQSASCEANQQALHCARPAARDSDEFGTLERAIGLPKDVCEYPLVSRGEQSIGDADMGALGVE